MDFPQAEPGEWIRPTRRGFRMQCCDCGLVHVVDFRLIPWGRGRKILLRMFRDKRATSAARRRTTKKRESAHG